MTGLAFTALKEGASPDAILAELRESVRCFGGLPDAELEQLARIGHPELERLAEERGIQTKPRPKPATVTPIKPGTPLTPVPPKPKPEVPAGVVIEDLPIEEFAAVPRGGADPLARLRRTTSSDPRERRRYVLRRRRRRQDHAN